MVTRARMRLFGCTLLVMAAPGCDDAAAPTPDLPSVVVQDSAGIPIVTNAGLWVADSTALQIDSTRMVTIGELKGDEPYLFGRVVGAVRQTNGRILVADAHTENIRVFGPDGLFMERIGRPGEGPGEYANLHGLQRLEGDSLLAIDWESIRRNILSPEGDWVRSQILRSLPVTRGIQSSAAAIFGDGTILAREAIRGCVFPAPEGIMCADTARFHRVNEELEEIAEFGIFPSGRRVTLRTGFPTNFGMGNLAWGQPYWFATGDRFYHVDGERFEVRVFRLDGELDRIVRVDVPLVEADPEDFNQPTGGSQFEEYRGRIQAAYLESEFPPHLPQVEDLRVDRVGRIWLREWIVHANQTDPPRWFVFAPDGELLYSLRQPLSRIHEIGEDYILGSSFDALGVERIQLLPLIGPGAGGPG